LVALVGALEEGAGELLRFNAKTTAPATSNATTMNTQRPAGLRGKRVLSGDSLAL
jgi:hypothetical protein